jgi:hypothetical protein
LAVNAFGAVCTAVVTLVFAYTKFSDGAWVVIFLIPGLVLTFLAIHRHYVGLARQLSLQEYGAPPRISRHRVIVPFGGIHRGTLAALRYARLLSSDVTALYVAVDHEQAGRIYESWQTWGEGIRLVILDSPYRLLIEPLLQYLEGILAHRQPNETVTIVVPQFISRNWLSNLLHSQTAAMLNLALIFKPGVVITNMPYQVD